ncbi:MAG: sigma-70 family RNA polymerase sigma factor [Vicinamibacterales bacterium]
MAADSLQGRAAVSRTDDELLAGARTGDPAALEALLVRYQPHLYRFGLRMCRNEDDASDVAQESLMAMARSVRDFRGDAAVTTWLYTIVRRFCASRRRRGKFAPIHEESLDAPGSVVIEHLADPKPGPEKAAADGEINAALTTAIDALEPGQREVLILRDVEGLPAQEVAAILGISVDAVKSRLHRARVAVRQRVAPLLGSVPMERPRPPLPPCPDVVTMFSRHLEGEIDRTVCERMEQHLERCAYCRGVCESLRRTLAFCRQSPVPQVPPPVAASVRAAIQAFVAQR